MLGVGRQVGSGSGVSVSGALRGHGARQRYGTCREPLGHLWTVGGGRLTAVVLSVSVMMHGASSGVDAL